MKDNADLSTSDPSIAPPPADAPSTAALKRPKVEFSGTRWFFSGIVRVLYRRWTRIAAHLFPEESRAEHVARSLHIPLPDQLNMSWVTDQLAVGGRIRPEDISALARIGVNSVVDTRSEYCDDAKALGEEGIELLHLPTPDTRPLSIEQMLMGAKWVQQRLDAGKRVVIHCEHGVGRSALLACAVLVYGGMHAQDAMQLVQQRRWQASPNHGQIVRLREFENVVMGQPSA
jgi:protein tyrosine phosphatase (PTP) superfamily phosphohydrolase (DUF442 family)